MPKLTARGSGTAVMLTPSRAAPAFPAVRLEKVKFIMTLVAVKSNWRWLQPMLSGVKPVISKV